MTFEAYDKKILSAMRQMRENVRDLHQKLDSGVAIEIPQIQALTMPMNSSRAVRSESATSEFLVLHFFINFLNFSYRSRWRSFYLPECSFIQPRSLQVIQMPSERTKLLSPKCGCICV
jgi:hypothetical protein